MVVFITDEIRTHADSVGELIHGPIHLARLKLCIVSNTRKFSPVEILDLVGQKYTNS